LSTIEELLDDFRKRLTVPWRGDEPSVFEDHLAETIRGELHECGPSHILALTGIASLFGLTRASSLIDKVVGNIPGRLLVTFPGVHRGGIYRLLDARDGWNYLAVPIPSTDRV